MPYREQKMGKADFTKIEILQPDKIDFNAEIADPDVDILVLGHQPGIGKTYSVLEYIKNNNNSAYFTARHSVIEEQIKSHNLNVNWWKGKNKLCWEDKAKNIPSSASCVNCKYSNICTYNRQFNCGLPIFGVFEHLSTKFVNWIDKSKKNKKPIPEIVFIDECKLLCDVYKKVDDKEILRWMDVIGVDPTPYSVGIVPNITYNGLKTYEAEIKHCHGNTILNAYNQDLKDILQEAIEYSPDKIFNYFYWADKYQDYTQELYSKPFWYYAFDLIKEGILPVFLDASFNPLWFNYMIECYDAEIGFNKDTVKVSYYVSEKERRYPPNPTTIYNMRQTSGAGGWYPVSSFISQKGNEQRPHPNMVEWLRKHLTTIIDIYGRENVGTITFKDMATYMNLLGVDCLGFGGLRSSNGLEDKDVLVVLGTYNGTKEQLFEHLKTIFYEFDKSDIIEKKTKSGDKFNPYSGTIDPYLNKLSPSDMEKWLNEKHKQYFVDQSAIADTYFTTGGKPNLHNPYMVRPVFWLNKAMWEDEMYQAYHRNRGLREKKIIFGYGWMPPHLLNEFKIETIPPNEEDDFFKDLFNTNKSGLTRLLYEDIIAGKKAKDLAEKYNINKKKGGRDTKPVTDLIKKTKDLEKRMKKR